MDPNILKEAMAAYQAVYNQEDVEHLDEMGQQGGRVTGSNPNVYKPAVTKSGPAGGGMGGRRGGGSSPGGIKPVAKPVTPAAKPAATAPAAKPVTPAAKPAATAPAAKLAAPVTKPAATPSAKVEPSTPAAKPSAMDTWAKANPRLAQAQKIKQQGGSRGEVNKALYNKGTAAAEKTPTVVKASYDMFSSSNVKGMIEAYADVYAPQEVDEALTGDRIKKAIKKPGGTDYTRMHSADPKKRPTKRGGRGERGASKQHDFGAADRGAGNKAARRAGKSVEDTRYEEVDIFDLVLEFLQSEGFAETLEEAEWMMANQLNAEDINAIVEAMGEEDDDEDDEKEMKKGKKSKKSEEDEEDDEEEDDDDLKEASYSAKAARAGKDIGKPGKAFAKIAASAGKRYGSKERGEKVAGAILAKLRAKRG